MSAPQIPPDDNVVPFPSSRRPTTPTAPANPFQSLTYELVMKQAREGTLNPERG